MINTIWGPSLFRPAGPQPNTTSPGPTPRPETPTPVALDRGFRSARLALSPFRKPPLPPTPSAAPVCLVQDGSYLEMLSLKLSEAVSKALAQPVGSVPAVHETLGGKQPIPNGRGHALGALIASELNATAGNPHLHRAIMRYLHRPLSVLVNNLSAQLSHLITAPAFHAPSAPTSQSPSPNATQLHALAIANFAGELLEEFDELNLGTDADARIDGLKAVREGLVSLVNRVVPPLVGAIKNELIPLIDALENAPPSLSKTTIASKFNGQHPSIVTLSGVIPVYAKALSRYTSTATAQTALAPFFISIIWRALVALSHRPNPPPSRPSSPSPIYLNNKKRRGSPASSPQVQMTATTGRFTIKGPPSRPPSPLHLQPLPTPASDARTLYDLLSLLPRPGTDKEASRLAREAVDEAFGGLLALHTFFDAIQSTQQHSSLTDTGLAEHLTILSSELPTLIALPPLLRMYGTNGAGSYPSVASLIGLSEDEYRNACLAGFGRAEECGEPVGQRVLDALEASPSRNSMSVVIKWLEAELSGTNE